MPELPKTLLVCTQRQENIEKHLSAAGCRVTCVRDGGIAISRARAEDFDAAVLVSTGRNMGLAETAFHLRAASPAMPIVILTNMGAAGHTRTLAEIIAGLIPNTRVLELDRLKAFFGSSLKEGLDVSCGAGPGKKQEL